MSITTGLRAAVFRTLSRAAIVALCFTGIATCGLAQFTSFRFPPRLLRVFHLALTSSLFFIGGITWCFILWIIPIIKLNHSRSALIQFSETTCRGHLYLKPISRIVAGLLAVTAFLVSKQADLDAAMTWKYFAAAFLTMVQVPWWEVYAIFPINDSVAAMEKIPGNFLAKDDNWLKNEAHAEFLRRMDVWTRRHIVRASLPLVAGSMLLVPELSRI